MALPRASAGGVVLNAEGKLLLVCQHNNSWSFPKGGIEPDEAVLDAAKREIQEETGVTELIYKGELGSYERYSINREGTGENMDWGLRKRTFFLFTTAQSDTTAPDPTGEVTDKRWVTIDEALELLTHPKDKEFLQSVRTKVEVGLK